MSELRRTSTQAPPEASRPGPPRPPSPFRNLIRSESFAEALGNASQRPPRGALAGLWSAEPPHDLPSTKRPEAPSAHPGAVDGMAAPPELGERAPVEDGSKRRAGEDQQQDTAAGGAHDAFADPLCRGLARANVEPPSAPRSLLQLDPRLAEMIQRVAWGRHGASSTLRLELGGKLRGAVLLLQGHERGGVSVSLELPHGEDPAEWRERIARRLGGRGLSLDALEVV